MYEVGFDQIYTHNRKIWANYWSPLLVASVTMIVHMHVVTSPVILTAVPGKIGGLFFNTNIFNNKFF